MTEDSTFSFFFSLGECFNYRVASSLTTSVQMSPSKFAAFVEYGFSEKRGKKSTLSLLLAGRIAFCKFLPSFFFFFFFFLFQTRHVGRHYSCSLSHFCNSPWHRHFDIQYFNCCRVIHLAVPSQQGMMVRQ